MQELIFIVEEALEGGFIAKALGHSIFTEGDNVDELKLNLKDAIKCHFYDSTEIPQIIRLHFVRDEIFQYA